MSLNTEINEAVSGLFSLGGLVAFVLGLLSYPAFYWVKSMIHEKKTNVPRPKIKSLWFLWALIFVYSFFIGVQQQRTADDLTTLTKNTAQCQKEFFTELKVKFDAGAETDRWSAVKTKAISDWIHTLLMPPTDMAERRDRDSNDIVYKVWALKVTAHYDAIIQQAEEQQQESLRVREQHPLPEPTCGK